MLQNFEFGRVETLYADVMQQSEGFGMKVGMISIMLGDMVRKLI